MGSIGSPTSRPLRMTSSSPLNPNTSTTRSMPTPSLVSDCASSASPSRVAKSPSLFRAWMDRAKVAVTDLPPLEVVDHFEKLYQIEEVSVLVQGPLPTFDLQNEPEFLSGVEGWASTLDTVEDDEFGILTALPTLALAFSRICRTANNYSKEHAQRRGVDDIIDLAFSARRDRHCNIGIEEGYRLVASPGNPDAVSDTLVTLSSADVAYKLSNDRLFFEDPSTVDHLYWWPNIGSTHGFSIIGFAGEFKKDEHDCNKNQVIMALATAQAQRKALGLKNSIVMGAIASRGHVQILSSYWTSEDLVVCIYVHKQEFNLSDPIQLVCLYVFLSKLEQEIQGTFARELKTWNIPTETEIQGHRWRSLDHKRSSENQQKRRRTDAGEGSRGGAGSNGGLVDVDGFDDDQYMDIIKWRNEVVEGGKEGNVVSEEDNAPWLQFEGRVIATV